MRKRNMMIVRCTLIALLVAGSAAHVHSSDLGSVKMGLIRPHITVRWAGAAAAFRSADSEGQRPGQLVC